MHVAKRIVTLVFVQLLLLSAARTAGAADAKEAMEKRDFRKRPERSPLRTKPADRA